MQAAYDLMEDIPNNLGLIINLIPFVFLLGLLFLLVYVLNNRSILSLTTSRPKVDFKRIFFSFRLIVFISIVGFLVSYYGDNSNIAWNFKPLNFFLLLFISLILFPAAIIGGSWYLFKILVYGDPGLGTEVVELGGNGGLIAGLINNFSLLGFIRGLLVPIVCYIRHCRSYI